MIVDSLSGMSELWRVAEIVNTKCDRHTHIGWTTIEEQVDHIHRKTSAAIRLHSISCCCETLMSYSPACVSE